MSPATRTGVLSDALAYVHYWESSERGRYQVSRGWAAREAVRIYTLTEAERVALFQALKLDPKS